MRQNQNLESSFTLGIIPPGGLKNESNFRMLNLKLNNTENPLNAAYEIKQLNRLLEGIYIDFVIVPFMQVNIFNLYF